MKRVCEVCQLNSAVALMKIEKPSGKEINLDVCLGCGLTLCTPGYLP